MNSAPIEERIANLTEQLRDPAAAGELTSGLVRQAVKLVVEQMLEAEVEELLGRGRYPRRTAGR
jgi:transposase-like protein